MAAAGPARSGRLDDASGDTAGERRGERFDLAAIAPQPWKNGAGITREIAFGGPSTAAFDWRLSVADIDRDAPFSAFPGIDRCIVLLQGGGMRLRAHDQSVDHALTETLAPFRFAGEIALDASLAAGPSRDLNVMTRRGAWRSDVSVLRDQGAVSRAGLALLLCVAGHWRVDGARLAPMQGWVFALQPDPQRPAHPLPSTGSAPERREHLPAAPTSAAAHDTRVVRLQPEHQPGEPAARWRPEAGQPSAPAVLVVHLHPDRPR